MTSKNASKKQLANESEKIQKAREKLHKRIQSIDAQITKEALKQKNHEIHRWISRHAKHRIVLKDKSISLFDNNQNAAKISQKISKLAKQINLGHFE